MNASREKTRAAGFDFFAGSAVMPRATQGRRIVKRPGSSLRTSSRAAKATEVSARAVANGTCRRSRSDSAATARSSVCATESSTCISCPPASARGLGLDRGVGVTGIDHDGDLQPEEPGRSRLGHGYRQTRHELARGPAIGDDRRTRDA
jgi:hypothetical protein